MVATLPPAGEPRPPAECGRCGEARDLCRCAETLGTGRYLRDPVELAEFSKFYKEKFPELVAFLRYMGASEATAWDCVQETMMKALPPEWVRIHSKMAWCRITCRRAYLRTVTRRREESVPDVEEISHRPVFREHGFELFEEVDEFLGYVSQLSSRQREVLAYHLSGANYVEIANDLDIDVANVRKHMSDARQKLRGLMGGGAGR